MPSGHVEFFRDGVDIERKLTDKTAVATIDIPSLVARPARRSPLTTRGDGNFSPAATTSPLHKRLSSLRSSPLSPAPASPPPSCRTSGQQTAQAIVELTNETDFINRRTNDLDGLCVQQRHYRCSLYANDRCTAITDNEEFCHATVKITVPIHVTSPSLSAGSYALSASFLQQRPNYERTIKSLAFTIQQSFPLSTFFYSARAPSAFISGTSTRAVATVRIANHGMFHALGRSLISSRLPQHKTSSEPQLSASRKTFSQSSQYRRCHDPLKEIRRWLTAIILSPFKQPDPQGNTASVYICCDRACDGADYFPFRDSQFG